MAARAANGNTLTKSWSAAANSWTPWANLGGYASSGPGISVRADGTVDYFVRGGDNTVYHRWTEPNGTAHDWENLGGVVTSAISASVRKGTGNIDLVARGQEGAIWFKTWDPNSGWSIWVSLGGWSKDAPTVTSPVNGGLDIFYRGGDDQIYTNSFRGSGWSGWASIGGGASGGPAAVVPSYGATDVFYTTYDGSTWQRSWRSGGWSQWVRHDSIAESAPAAYADGSVVGLIVRGGSRLYHDQWSGSSWSGWADFGSPDAPGEVPVPSPGPIDSDNDGGDDTVPDPNPNGDALIDPQSAECAPTPDGIDARCSNQIEEDPDDAADTGGVYEPSALSRSLSAITTSQVRSLIVARPYATIRSGPGSFAVGNAKDGWTFDRVVAKSSARFGTVYGTYKGCGWVKNGSAPTPNGGTYPVPSGSPRSGCARNSGAGKVYPLTRFAKLANCHGEKKTERYCDRVSGGLTLAAGTVECFNVGPILHTGGVTTPCNGGDSRTIPTAHGKGAGGGAGQDVGWRYVTKDGKWVAIKDGYYSVNQPAYVFVRRSDLPANLCPRLKVGYQKDQNGNDDPNRPMNLCAPTGSLYPVPPNK